MKKNLSASNASTNKTRIVDKGRAPKAPFLEDLRRPLKKHSSFDFRRKKIVVPRKSNNLDEFLTNKNEFFASFSPRRESRTPRPEQEFTLEKKDVLQEDEASELYEVFMNFKLENLKVSVYRETMLTIF